MKKPLFKKRAGERVFDYLEENFPGVGGRLPSIRAVASVLDVSTRTVQNVYRRLAEQKKIRSEVGNGTFWIESIGGRKEHSPMKIGLNVPTEVIDERDTWSQTTYGGLLEAAIRNPIEVTFCSFTTQELRGTLTPETRKRLSTLQGAILLCTHDLTGTLRYLDGEKISYACYNPPHVGATSNFISPDYYSASYRIGSAWRCSGRKHLLFLTCNRLEESASSVLRISGMAAGYGASFGEGTTLQTVFAEDFLVDDGRRAMEKHLAAGGRIPDAVYTAGDYLAIGAIEALRNRNLRIPEDVSVIGGTGLDIDSTGTQRLTCTRQPFKQLGQHLFNTLIERIKSSCRNIPGVYLPIRMVGDGTVTAQEWELLASVDSPDNAPAPHAGLPASPRRQTTTRRRATA